MLAGTQRATRRQGISEDGGLGEGGGLQRKGQKPGIEWEAKVSWGRSSPPGPSWLLRSVGWRSGAGDGLGAATGGRAVARRVARAHRSWVAAGCWCWSVGRESPPRWHPRPSHTWPFLSRAGCGRRSSPVPRGCHRRSQAAPPHLPARGSALRQRGLSNTERGGVPETRKPRPRPLRKGLAISGVAALGAPAWEDFAIPQMEIS